MKPIEQQIMLITGSTDGIGMKTAHDLAARGAKVLVHGRSRKKAEATIRKIRNASDSETLPYYVADLSSLAEVRKLAEAVIAENDRLDVLINNAGVGPGKSSDKTRAVSRDGYELRLAVNYLAPFLLTHLLLPALQRAAPARIVNVSSAAQSPVDFNNVMLEHRYDPMTAYAQSKLALTMFTLELAERLQPETITVNCLHPGTLLDTKMVLESSASPQGSAQSGAQAEIYVATDPGLKAVTGKYFNRTREARAHAQAYDREARKKLWQLSEKLTGIRNAP